MAHQTNCPALDPFAYLLGDYGQCTCGAEPPAPPSSGTLLARRMSRHAAEVGEWLNMVRGARATLTGLALTTAASLSGMSLGWLALFLASYIATALP